MMGAALSQDRHEGADLVGTYHRIAGIGPVYEVIGTAEKGVVRICLVESGDMVDYPVDDVRADPED